MGFPGGSGDKESTRQVGHLGWEDLLEQGKATHSSILACKIPMDRGAWRATLWSQKIGHDRATKHSTVS